MISFCVSDRACSAVRLCLTTAILLVAVAHPVWSQWNCTGGTCSTTGNVGIGTAAPGGALHVQSPTDSVQFVLGQDGNNTYALGRSLLTGYLTFTGFQSGFSGYRFVTTSSGGGIEALRITNSGNVGIGTTNPQYKLAVEGAIGARDIIVTNTPWSDYVFRPGYRLRPLSEVASFIRQHGHLPEIPSEAEVKEKGVSVAEVQAKLLAKIEELTLHMIEADGRNDRLEQQNADLQHRLAVLEKTSSTESASTSTTWDHSR